PICPVLSIRLHSFAKPARAGCFRARAFFRWRTWWRRCLRRYRSRSRPHAGPPQSCPLSIAHAAHTRRSRSWPRLNAPESSRRSYRGSLAFAAPLVGDGVGGPARVQDWIRRELDTLRAVRRVEDQPAFVGAARG